MSMRARRMRTLVITLTAVGALSGCGSDAGITNPPPPPPTAVRLKDIEIPNLPSPYYHFDYDGQGRVSSVSFASGFTTYDVSYVGGRIGELKNNTIANH